MNGGDAAASHRRLDSERGETEVDLKSVRVILAVLYWNYGRPQTGHSFEYYNLYLTLREMCDTKLFDFHSIMLEKGKEAMNRELLALVKRERPDIVIIALFTDQFLPEVIEELKQYTRTVCYFFDDGWRIDYSNAWVPHFHHVTTTSTHRLRLYREAGHHHVIYSPPGFNEAIYRRKVQPKQYDVSFVGGGHPYRDWIIAQMRRAGLRVHRWGHRSPGVDQLSQDAMIDVFNQTKINLNISNSVSWDLRYLRTSLRAIRVALRSLKNREQLKGRHFEICGCGGFQLTYYVEDLERCYAIGDEIVIYMDVDDLIEKARYYLKHEDEREAIAEAGYRRALADHTYQKRFRDIMNHVLETRPG